MADVSLCLGRPLVLRGTVVTGEQRGRRIGFPHGPTSDCGRQLFPCDGVYAGTVDVYGATYAAAVSVGVKPTFGQHQLTCEAHLIDFDGDLYEHTLDVRMLRWMRDQMAFPNADALVRQLQHDVAGVRQMHDAGLLDPAESRISGCQS